MSDTRPPAAPDQHTPTAADLWADFRRNLTRLVNDARTAGGPAEEARGVAIGHGFTGLLSSVGNMEGVRRSLYGMSAEERSTMSRAFADLKAALTEYIATPSGPDGVAQRERLAGTWGARIGHVGEMLEGAYVRQVHPQQRAAAQLENAQRPPHTPSPDMPPTTEAPWPPVERLLLRVRTAHDPWVDDEAAAAGIARLVRALNALHVAAGGAGLALEDADGGALLPEGAEVPA